MRDRVLMKTFRNFSLQIGLASQIIMKMLHRGKCESVPKGASRDFQHWEKSLSLANEGKLTCSMIVTDDNGLECSPYVKLLQVIEVSLLSYSCVIKLKEECGAFR